ncbi:hypothetical protein BZG36_02520 [Bifiguratus adelaidae]|uniref:Deoxycytidylate deaminase n=1 Tax=Bifiguratus adelaidae TaxID=1938954 RepID=A0A261Y2P6_9FUNG|nr:hypothetical protein BZG36_02520 [Bifiguratus adelaidae]
MFIGITGPRCAGKHAVASFLVSLYGFQYIALSDGSDSNGTADQGGSQDEHVGLADHTLSFETLKEVETFVTERWQQDFVTCDVDIVSCDLLRKRPFVLIVAVEAPITMRYSRYKARCTRYNYTMPSMEDFIVQNDKDLYGPMITPTTSTLENGSTSPQPQRSPRTISRPTKLYSLIANADLTILNSYTHLPALHHAIHALNLTNMERLRPSWDTYFMHLSDLAARRSNCMKRRVGCILVKDCRVIATGYNGTPRGLKNCNQGGCRRCNEATPCGADLDRCLCMHAEENALLEAGRDRVFSGTGSTLYCNTCPCLVKIVQVGVKEVVYSRSYGMDAMTAQIFAEAGVKLRQHSVPSARLDTNALSNNLSEEAEPQPDVTSADRVAVENVPTLPMEERQFTLRAAVVGLAIGTLLAFSNMYFGLQTGWISMMSLQSALVGYAIFKTAQGRNVGWARGFESNENVVLQTVSVATGTMPLAAGFVGIIPALALLTEEDNPGGGPIVLTSTQLIIWSMAVAFFGVFFAVPLRVQTIIREKLRFPSGTATAQMISVLHGKPIVAGQSSSVRLSTRDNLRQRTAVIRSENEALEEVIGRERQPLLPLREEASSQGLHREESPRSYTSATPSSSSASLEPITQDLARSENWRTKVRALIYSFSLSSVYTIFTYFYPPIGSIPIFDYVTFGLLSPPPSFYLWTFSPSLSYVGQGIIMGLPTTLSMLAGCVVGWGILSPLARSLGWAPGPVDDWKEGSKGWILWISLGVMIAESVVSLTLVSGRSLWEAAAAGRLFSRGNKTAYIPVEQDLEDISSETEEIEKEEADAPPSELVSPTVTIVGLLLSSVLCLVSVRYLFGTLIPMWSTTLAVLLAMLLSILGVRALGETDLNPVSGIGKISQVIFAGVLPGGIVANLIAGGIAEAGAQQAGDLMQDLKTGHLLGASPKAQFYGQLLGSFVSVFASTAAYRLYTTIYTVPGKEFPAPTAQVWLDMSRLVNGQALPPHVMEFVIAFGTLFAFLVLIKDLYRQHTWTQYIPQGIAFAVGIYNTPNFTLARVIGGVIAWWWQKFCQTDRDTTLSNTNGWLQRYRDSGQVLIIVVASGFVLGEGSMAVVNLIMRALGVPHW